MTELKELRRLFDRAYKSRSSADYVKFQEAMLEDMEEVPVSDPMYEQMKGKIRREIERVKRRLRIIECPDCKGKGCSTCDDKGKVKATIEKLK